MRSSQPKKQVSRFFTIVVIRHIVHNTVEFRKLLQFSEFGFSVMTIGPVSVDAALTVEPGKVLTIKAAAELLLAVVVVCSSSALCSSCLISPLVSQSVLGVLSVAVKAVAVADVPALLVVVAEVGCVFVLISLGCSGILC